MERLKGKGQAPVTKIPSQSPCHRNVGHRLSTSLSKTKGTTSFAVVPKDRTQTGKTAFPGDVVDPASSTDPTVMGKKIRIPTKVLFDAMMQQLGLPNAVYSTQKARAIGLDATIHFYASKHQLDNNLPRQSISTHVSNKLEEVEDQLANEAPKYMKSIHSKVLQDINYDKMQLLQQKCEALEHQQKEKDNLIDYFSNSWCDSLGGDHMPAKELYRIIDSNFTS
ncbi:hypothetical protein ACQJBY_022500 [Aegilops geniculata]